MKRVAWLSPRRPRTRAGWPSSASVGPLAPCRPPGSTATRCSSRNTGRSVSWRCPASGFFRCCFRRSAEDTDLTLKIRRAGYQIRYEEDGVAFTEAPEDTRGLAKQRFRWAFGTLQAAWKHRDALFVPKYGTLGFVALPSIWIFQVLLSALSPFAELAMIVALFAGNWRIVLIFYLGFFVLEFLTGLMAYWLEGEKPWDLALLFFQRIYYRELMYYVVAKSLIYAVRGRVVGWGKLERRATVAGV